MRRNESLFKVKLNGPNHDIALSLLRTCRTVYLETWTLPLSLNPWLIYDMNDHADIMKPHVLLHWQLALIQRLDISHQQYRLEGGTIENYLHYDYNWQFARRHTGVYIAPHRHRTPRGTCTMGQFPHAFNCSVLSAQGHTEQRQFLSTLLGQHHHAQHSQPPWQSAMRVMIAKPLTHLTLRLRHTDWWTWADHPDAISETQHLGLDPAIGTGGAEDHLRPTASRMRALAERRRAGEHPDINTTGGWLRTIGKLPDLKRLEFVLETYKAKEQQLDAVVDAAKTWKFPIEGTAWELVWDGNVEASRWSSGEDEWQDDGEERGGDGWYGKAREFSVRRVKFVRKRATA